jgi:hypothetical protein
MPPTQNTTHIKVPPAAVLGEVAYRQLIFQYTRSSSLGAGSWATWEQLSDDDRQAWRHVGMVVAREVARANSHE